MIRAALILLAAIALALPARAEEAADSEAAADALASPGLALTLGEVIVRGERPADQRPSVYVVTREDFAAAGARTVAEALAAVPGVRVDAGPGTEGGNGKRESLASLRGLDPQHVIVLLDGVPIYEPRFRVTALEQIPLAAVREIRVVQGPGTVLYGPNGLAGVVNILTREGQEGVRSGLAASYGDVDAWAGEAYLSGAARRFDYFAQASFDSTRGFLLPHDFGRTRNEDGGLRENTDRVTYDLSGKLGHRWDAARLSVLAGHHSDEGGVPFSMEAVQPGTLWRKRWDLSRIAVLAEVTPHRRVWAQGNAYLNRYFNTITTYEDATMSTVAADGKAVSTYDNYVLGYAARPSFDLAPAGVLTLAYGYKYDDVRVQSGTGGEWTRFAQENYHGALEEEYSVSIVTLRAGAGYGFLRKAVAEGFRLGPDRGALDYTVAAEVAPLSQLKIGLSHGHKTSFPDLRALYSAEGNPGLKPESANLWDLGILAEPLPQLGASASLFYTDARDLIGRRQLGNTFEYENVDRARLWGADVALRVRPVRWLAFFPSYGYLRTRDLRGDRDLDELDFRPRHRLFLDLRLTFDFGLAAYGQYEYVSERRYQKTGAEGGVGSLPERGLVAAKFAYTLRWGMRNAATFFVQGENLGDVYYQDAPELAQPGRMLRGGIELEL